jgi:hypothetical protein
MDHDGRFLKQVTDVVAEDVEAIEWSSTIKWKIV